MTSYPTDLGLNSLELIDSGRDLKHCTGVDDQISKQWAQGAMNPAFARRRIPLVQRHYRNE